MRPGLLVANERVSLKGEERARKLIRLSRDRNAKLHFMTRPSNR